MNSTFEIVESYKKLGVVFSNEMEDYSYPGDEPELDGLTKTDEQISRNDYEWLRKLYPYPSLNIYMFKGVKSVVLYHNIDTMTIKKSIFDLSIALDFVHTYKDVFNAEMKTVNDRISARKTPNQSMLQKPVNSLEYGTKKELAILRKNVGHYYDRLNNLLTENVIKIIGNNSPAGWKNLGKTLPPHEKCQVEIVENTLKYIDDLAVYKKK